MKNIDVSKLFILLVCIVEKIISIKEIIFVLVLILFVCKKVQSKSCKNREGINNLIPSFCSQQFTTGLVF